jgi:hypothetical protein
MEQLIRFERKHLISRENRHLMVRRDRLESLLNSTHVVMAGPKLRADGARAGKSLAS